MSGTPTPAGWYPDPSSRHELRYWSGETWTDQVADAGVVSTDGLSGPAAPTVAADTGFPGYGSPGPAPGAGGFPGYGSPGPAPGAGGFPGYGTATVTAAEPAGRSPMRIVLLAAAVVAVVAVAAFLLLGGDDEGGIAEPSTTTAAEEGGATTLAPETTAVVEDTMAPLPTEPPVTTVPTGAGEAYPQVVIDNFVGSCSAGQPVEACECAIDAIQQTYTLEAFVALEQEFTATGVFPTDLLNVIEPCFA